MLKKEQFERLIPYEQHLKTAQGDYVHGLYTKDVNALEEVYNELGYKLNSRSCAGCLIDMCKIIGVEYFKYKERYYERDGNKKTSTSGQRKKSNKDNQSESVNESTEN